MGCCVDHSRLEELEYSNKWCYFPVINGATLGGGEAAKQRCGTGQVPRQQRKRCGRDGRIRRAIVARADTFLLCMVLCMNVGVCMCGNEMFE